MLKFGRRKVVLVLLVLALVLVFQSVAFAADKKPEFKWRFGVPWSRPAFMESFQLFCDLANLYTDGRLEIELFPDGLLGNHNEIFHEVRDGEIDVAMLVPYVSLVPGGIINYFPWTVTNYDEFSLAFKAPEGILYKVVEKAYNEVNMHVLFTLSGGGYGIGNNVRPLKSPEDFKNMKLRVSSSLGLVKALANMGEGSGMNLETVPWSELYNALSRKVVDGCWSTLSLLVAERQYEVMKYYTDLGFCWDAAQILVNSKNWEKLPDDIKQGVEKASRVAELHLLEVSRNSTLQDRRTLVEKGLEIYTPTPAELKVFFEKSKVSEIWEELAKPWLDEAFPGENMTEVVQEELKKIRAQVSGN